ncbi:hypothetical protein FPV67DRAFT_429044 [Lyophyllum atratum]|nr:hypothetical protein FPV67DRAFT_429044 [Lyophyllum atratum]
MSVGRPGVQLTIVSDAEYRDNQERIEQAQATLDSFKAMNNAAKEAYDKQKELIRKIEEGREAERQLLALADASGSGPSAAAGPSGQPNPTLASYNPGWQSAIAPFAAGGDAQRYYEHVNYGGNGRPQMLAYGSSSDSGQNYMAQTSGNQYHQQFQANAQPQRPTQQFQRTPQVGQTTRPVSTHVWGKRQPSQQAAARVPEANGRMPTPSGEQMMSIARGRQALRMQPVTQQSLHLNQPQPLPTASSAPPPIRSQNTSMQRPTQQAQTVTYTTPAASRSAVPNFIEQVFPSTTPSYRPPAAPGSSSLAGALDARRSGSGSTNVQSNSVMPSSTAAAGTIPTSLGATVTRLQQQIVGTNASSSPRTVPTRTAAPNGSSTTTAVPAEITAVPNTPTAMDTSSIIETLTSNPTWMGRLKTIVDGWQATAPPHSFFSLPGTNIKVYKDAKLKVYLVIQHSQQEPAKYIYLDYSRLLSLMASASASVTVPAPAPAPSPAPTPASTSQNVYQDDKGNFQYLTEPLTPEQATRYRPYSIPPEATVQQPARPVALGTLTNTAAISSVTPTTSSTASPVFNTTPGAAAVPTITTSPLFNPLVTASGSIRTPADADKKRLAKDLLRALNQSPQKQSQLDRSSASLSEPPAKRHASGEGINASLSSPAADQLRPKANGVPPPSTTPQSTQAQQRTDSDTGGHISVPPGNSRPWSFYSVHSEGGSLKPSSIPATVQSSQSSASLPSISIAKHDNIIISPSRTPQPILNPHSKHPQADDVASTPNNVFPLPSRPKTPLFLPSPSLSPCTKPTGSTIDDIANDLILDDISSPRRHAAKSQPFYILVPPVPDYIQRYKTQQAGRKRHRSSMPVVDGPDADVESRSSTVYGEDIIDTDPASNDFVNDNAEREAVILSCSRLLESPCKWDSCGTVLSSAEKLILHFAFEHRPQSTSKGSCVCMWQQCGRYESNSIQLFNHMKNHATFPLLCAYKDCQGVFWTACQLTKHHKAEHSNAPLKPPATIFAPTLEPPPDTSGVVPSYLLEPVRASSISKERHAVLGPWVLRNIAGPVNLGMKRYNAASKLSRTSSGEGENRPGIQPYDFLNFPSTNFSTSPSKPSRIRGMDNLDSGEVSEMVHDGMLLWHVPDIDAPKEEVEDDENEESFSLRSPKVWPEEEQDEAPMTEFSENSASRDEEAVEIMLAMP